MNLYKFTDQKKVLKMCENSRECGEITKIRRLT